MTHWPWANHSTSMLWLSHQWSRTFGSLYQWFNHQIKIFRTLNCVSTGHTQTFSVPLLLKLCGVIFTSHWYCIKYYEWLPWFMYGKRYLGSRQMFGHSRKRSECPCSIGARTGAPQILRNSCTYLMGEGPKFIEWIKHSKEKEAWHTRSGDCVLAAKMFATANIKAVR